MVLNYIGSKKSLLPFINDVVKTLDTDSNMTFCDAFSGTGSVSNFFKDKFNMVSNDKEYYSYIITYGYIISSFSTKLKQIIDTLNNLEPKDGLLTKNYTLKYTNRMFFTEENSTKIDSIRIEIERLFKEQRIDKDEYMFLLASLLESSDKVANVACVYGSFLKTFKKSSLSKMILKPLHTNINLKKNKVHQKDIQEFLNDETKYDIVYLDPPYNSRQYSSNYFLLNYLSKYEDVPIKGKTGILLDCYKSDFSSKRNVLSAFEKMINKINSKYILLSYNNEGLLSPEELMKILEKNGTVKVHTKLYNKFKSQRNDNKDKVYEYIYEITK